MRRAVPPSRETMRWAAVKARQRAQQARRWRAVVNVLAAVALVCALVFLIGALAACEPKGDKFDRQCAAKGGVVHTTHRGGTTSRVCKPAPQPRPQPGWQ